MRVVILGDAVMLWVVGGVVSGGRREFGGGIRCWREPGREQADNVVRRQSVRFVRVG